MGKKRSTPRKCRCLTPEMAHLLQDSSEELFWSLAKGKRSGQRPSVHSPTATTGFFHDTQIFEHTIVRLIEFKYLVMIVYACTPRTSLLDFFLKFGDRFLGKRCNPAIRRGRHWLSQGSGSCASVARLAEVERQALRSWGARARSARFDQTTRAPQVFVHDFII